MFSTLDPAFSTRPRVRPRVFHRAPRFPSDPAFSTGPCVFHQTQCFPHPGIPYPRTPHPGTPAPRFPSSPRIVATLHITFSWLPLPIGQVCSQVWCRPYLAAHFGFFDLRTFPLVTKSSPSKCVFPLHTQSRFQVHLRYTYKL